MKNVINYFYHLYPEKIYNCNDYYFFYLKDFKYILCKLNREDRELEELIKISNKLYENKILVNTFIMSSFNTFSILYNKEKYILMKINGDEKEEYDIYDLTTFNNYLRINNNKLLINENWIDLWSYIVDKVEEQISDFNDEFKELLDYAPYYIGLAENAISYAKNTLLEHNSEETLFVLCHRKLDKNISQASIYNPLNFIFDYEIRDIAEYIKIKFFNNNLDFEEIEKLLSVKRYSPFLLKMLYARLLYPSYFFDIFYKIVYEDYDEESFKLIKNKARKYEELLSDIYFLIKKFTNIEKILWTL